MTPHALQAVRAQLERDEGFKACISLDSRGRRTIGYGTNLDAGITLAQGAVLLECGLDDAIRDVARVLGIARLDDVRFGVLVQLRYHLGLKGFLGFEQLLAHCVAGQWDAAAGALIDSAADHQEPARMMRWAHELRTGIQL
jgi:GH24 family phage-related lysozyme (muramidase)